MYASSLKIDTQVAAELQPELLPGEYLLWAGRPLRKVVFHSSDWIAIPFSLLWGGFAIFWEGAVAGYWGNPKHGPSGTPIEFFNLWGIPFVLAGQYLIWGRFARVAWKKKRTYYGLTNNRVIVVNVSSNRKQTAAYLNGLDACSLSTRSDGIGTIEFAPEPLQPGMLGFARRGQSLPSQAVRNPDLSRLAFFDIQDARSVYQQIQALRERMASA
jgi:hypothetical protein